MWLSKPRWLIPAAALVAAALVAAAVLISLGVSAPAVRTQPLVSPGVRVCGNRAILDSPYHYDGPPGTFTAGDAPRGLPTFGSVGTRFPRDKRIVVVPAGNNTLAAHTGAYKADNTVFYFEPGSHVVQGVMYTGAGAVYIGGYNSRAGVAAINGVNGAARGGDGGRYLSLSHRDVANADQVWEYLTIENFTSSRNNAVIGNVSSGGFASGNTYKYDTIGPNEYGYAGRDVPPRTGESSGGGYAIGDGSYTTIEYNCLTRNAQGAFNGGGVNDIISHNEISWNGLGEYPDAKGPGGSPYRCGCSGGGKLFSSVNAIITHNYVHDNYDAGIWVDFNNTGADISFNYIASNWRQGIVYEASYNASISDNTLVGNGWASDGPWPAGVHGLACNGGVSCRGGDGPISGAAGGFPYAAIYLANSGGNDNLRSINVPACRRHCTVRSAYEGELLVEGNSLIDNFGGVMVYTDTDRYPGNVGNDSACGIPLGALHQANNSIYYRQTRELHTAADATVKGTSVTSRGGTLTLCSGYGGEQSGSRTEKVARPPSVGISVFNMRTGRLLGEVTKAISAHAFSINRRVSHASGLSLLLSAYGGCGPADYYGGGPGRKSGRPAAYYWDNCIWGSRNVTVSKNRFFMESDRVAGCTKVNMCGFMGNVAFNAGVPVLMRFFKSYRKLTASAADGLGNVWSRNVYSWSGSGGAGQWQFWAGLQGHEVTRQLWTSPPYGQDTSSTFK